MPGAWTPAGMTSLLSSNMMLESELLSIYEAFERAHIDCVVLKGVPLTRQLHDGALWRRTMIDNDLLVRRTDAPNAEKILRELGYFTPLRSFDFELRHNYQCAFARPVGHDAHFLAELHWNAFNPLLFQVPESELWEDTEVVEIRGKPMKVLGPTMSVLHLAAHFAQHKFAETRVLEDFTRAWKLWEQRIDQRDLWIRADRYGVFGVLSFAFLCSGVEATRSSLRARMLASLLPPAKLGEPDDAHKYHRRLAPLLLMRSDASRRWLTRVLVPPREGSSVERWEALGRHWLRPLRRLLR